MGTAAPAILGIERSTGFVAPDLAGLPGVKHPGQFGEKAVSTTDPRAWIEEFTGVRPLLREFVIREREGGFFEIFQVSPERRVFAALTTDEVVGFFAIAILRGMGGNTPEQERAWVAKYGRWGSAFIERPPLEPWQKQLPEEAGT